MTKPLVIRSPLDAIAAVPYLLGFHPSRSLVVIGFGGRAHGTCAIRLDLPATGGAGKAAALLAANGFGRSLVLGYGPPGEVGDAAAGMRAALEAAGVPAAEAIRVADGRWWSLTCGDDCCPAEGTPYDISASALSAQAVYAGHVALADRTELVRSVQPFGGPVRTAMRQATKRAEKDPVPTGSEALAAAVDLLSRAPSGSLTDGETARLGVLLTDLRIRDEAWIRINEDAPGADIAFWRDVLRRVEDRYAPAPASLLAFAAYTAGDGGLANVALERALDADPRYSMAILLREVINAGVPPSKLRTNMTPAQLAAAYEDIPPPEGAHRQAG